MTHRYDFARDDDLPAVARLLSDAFAGPVEGSELWARIHGAPNVRVMRPPDPPPGGADACLVRIPMGQYFGGRSVPMVGIAGVAVSPVKRGLGLAREMMGRCLLEHAEAGFAISALYASTRPLYRQVGYEAAGRRFEVSLAVAHLPRFPDPRPVRALTEADQEAMSACYAEAARWQDGMLDRGAYIWQRVWKFREEAFRGFGVFGPGGLEGYVMISQRRNPEFGKHDIALSDAILTTHDAARSLCTFLAGYATMGDRLIIFGTPSHPLTMLLPHHHEQVRLQESWMLRVLSVKGALEARGYPPGLRARVVLDVADGLIEENRGVWTLEVEGGRGRATRGGSGPAIRATIGGLAAMYTGFLTPARAAVCGLASGDAGVLHEAWQVFAGPAPAMVDFF
jgi:predicted acetyltransferase